MKTKIFVVLVLLSFAFTANAIVDPNWTGSTSTSWSDAGNWDSGVPAATNIAYISYTGTNDPLIVSAVSCKDVRVGQVANVEQVTLAIANGGSLTTIGTGTLEAPGASGYFCIGSEAGTKGKVTVVDGASLTAGDNIIVGRYGTGYLDMTGGTVATNTKLTIGEHAGSLGSATISGGTLTAAGVCELGKRSNGSLTISGGTVNVGSLQTSVTTAGAVGTLTVTAGQLNTTSSYIRLGNLANNNVSSTTTVSGTGSVSVKSYMSVGHETSTGTQTLNLSENGSITTKGGFVIGRKGPGVFNMTGGTFLADNDGVAGNGKVLIGEQAAGVGTWNMSGGTATADDYIAIGYVSNIEQLVNVTGGTIITNDLDVGRDGTGRLKITGKAATIQSNNLYVGSYTTLNGVGTLEFKVGASGVTAIQALQSVTLDAGGTGSIADLLVSLSAAPPFGDICLIDNQSANAVSGIFDSVNGGSAIEGAAVTLTFNSVNYDYTLTYIGGVGSNDVMLIIPEPATLVMFAATGLVYFFKRRR